MMLVVLQCMLLLPNTNLEPKPYTLNPKPYTLNPKCVLHNFLVDEGPARDLSDLGLGV